MKDEEEVVGLSVESITTVCTFGFRTVGLRGAREDSDLGFNKEDDDDNDDDDNLLDDNDDDDNDNDDNNKDDDILVDIR